MFYYQVQSQLLGMTWKLKDLQITLIGNDMSVQTLIFANDRSQIKQI